MRRCGRILWRAPFSAYSLCQPPSSCCLRTFSDVEPSINCDIPDFPLCPDDDDDGFRPASHFSSESEPLSSGIGSFFRSALQRTVLFLARKLGVFESPGVAAAIPELENGLENFSLDSNLPQPRHVGIILDGNRRYARDFLSGDPWDGHAKGTRTVEDLVDWAVEDFPFLETLTLYSFSTENFHRSVLEREFLLRLFSSEIAALLERMDEVVAKGVKLNFMGRLDSFDEYQPDLRTKMALAEEFTSECSNVTVNFAMAYGGQAEIVDATKKIIDLVRNRPPAEIDDFVDALDESRFRDFLYLGESPDLIIRTGGRFRVSNFLLYQCAYSEWFFLEKLWPEFTKEDLARILMEFQQRQISRGK